MNTNHHQQPCTVDAGAAQAASQPTQPACQQIKLALDVHAATIVVVRMLDGAKPQPPLMRREGYGNDTTQRDRGDRPRSLAARFPSFQFSQETDATNPTDRHN
jgi:hypothetical protein